LFLPFAFQLKKPAEKQKQTWPKSTPAPSASTDSITSR
jgi:hypothetical protein